MKYGLYGFWRTSTFILNALLNLNARPLANSRLDLAFLAFLGCVPSSRALVGDVEPSALTAAPSISALEGKTKSTNAASLKR